MNIAPLRAARAIGLVLVALSVTASAAASMESSSRFGPTYGGGVRADSIAPSSVSAVQCPCNPDLPRANPANARASLCPCNAGLPDGLSGALVSTGLRSTGPAPASQPRATAIQSQGAFDWADAAIGAGVTVVVGLLVAGAVIVVGRRRWGAALTPAGRR